MYKNLKVFTIVSFIFISILLTLFSPDFFASAFGGGKNLWFWSIIIIGLVFSLILEYFDRNHQTDYIEANKIAYTPHNIYGLYALIYVVVFFILFYLYIFLSK
jgi:hypothetical protein